MFKAFRHWFIKVLGGGVTSAPRVGARPQTTETIEAVTIFSATHIVPHDENLLERARTQWQFGDWQSLAAISRDTLQHHPDRAKLALFAAAGCLQTQQVDEGKEFLRLAQAWGVSKKHISQILVAGVYNCLGRASMAKGEDQAALNYFEESIRIAQASADSRLAGEARAVREATQLGLLPQAVGLMNRQLHAVKTHQVGEQARVKILETELELLHHELSLAQQRQQLFSPQRGPGAASPEGSDEWKAQLKNRSVSQLGQDLWVLEKTGYKRDGFFVEFGATDGVLLSNTYLLEKEYQWTGICAEPNPKFYAQLQKNRNCLVSNQCISGATGLEVEFVFANAYGGFLTNIASDGHRDKRRAYLDDGNVAKIITISLHDFLVQSNAPKEIDYISIDTEGSEYEILQDFPFDQWKINIFTIEHNFTSNRQKIQNLLKKHGYHCTEADFDDWYELKE